MPRFSDNEKAMIQDNLLLEGEQLFSRYGIRKVTVDDLAKAVDIAKGSFYAFYTSKEHLYMAILTKLQDELWERVDSFLETNRELPPKELTKKTIAWSLEQMRTVPMLMQFNGETADYLFRKLPKEIIEEHSNDDGEAFKKLISYGVDFSCDIEIVVKTIQIFAMTSFQYHDEEDPVTVAALNTMLNGIVNEIVSDTL